MDQGTGPSGGRESDEWAVVATRLRKVYDTGKVKVDALKDVDLRVRKGEVVSVMGPSGCGKTTLLNCLSGIDDPTEGTVAIEGHDLAAMSDNERSVHRASRMGFIFQTYNLFPVLTAVENVEIPLVLTGTHPKRARAKALEMLRTVGLDEWAGHRPAELSSGQQQRVTLARALINDPAIVWADEPTGMLDSKTALQVLELLLAMNRARSQTIVMVTHDSKIGERAERVLRMDSGTFVEEYRPRGP